MRRVISKVSMSSTLVIIIVLLAVFIGLPIYMWQRHGWNLISESASAVLDFVRNLMP